MTRAEHLAWAKQRALEYVNAGDLQQAYASFTSDLSKHVELTETLMLAVTLGLDLIMAGHLTTQQKMREWIEGFN